MVVGNVADAGPAPSEPLPVPISEGGGLYSTNGTISIRNSILASHTPNAWAGTGLIDGGYNLSSDASVPFSETTSRSDTDPKLAFLDDFSGPTPTIPLLQGSPALDSADPQSNVAIDQRGRARPFGTAPDIGAFESSTPYSIMGTLHGYTPPGGATVTAGSESANARPDDSFVLHQFGVGDHELTPEAADAVFVPSSRSITVTWDTFGIDFQSYRSNAFAINPSPTPHSATFAGKVGDEWIIFGSPDLETWQPIATNTIQENGLFTQPLPANHPTYWFKALKADE